MQYKHLDNIIKANNDNRLAIFIGAGITKNCETETVKVPLWEDLIDNMKSELSSPHESDFLKIAELYFLEFGEFTYFEKIKHFFSIKLQPTEIHKILFDINPDVVITTNWDDVLETTIEENAYIYEVIRCDKDLVKSTLQKKLIKIHGDFIADNIVFKESDYLNYSNNFPIIENYIKSILSTHTVLFLGYSYSDYNLKQIIKWQQYHSDVQPPRYLVQFSDNVSQTKYLQAHGITTLTLEGTQESHTSRLIKFLKKLNNNPRSYLLNYQSNPEIFILEKLTIFSGLDRILFEQIQKSLTNCKFLYDNNDVILQFFIDEMSFNYDPVIRKIYQQFVTNLAKKNLDEKADFSPATTEIFDILSRANIKGIAISTSEKGTEYIPIEKDTRSERMYFNFDIQHSEECVISSNEVIWDLMHLAFACYQIQEYEKAYKLTEEAISKSRKERMYVYLFIAMYNRNHLLRCLQVDPLTHEKFSDIEYYDLEEMYLNLSQDIRAVAKPIHDFVNFSLLHKFLFDISVDLKNKEEASKQLKHGGFSFSADADKTACRQKNLLSFFLANAIMIEEYQDFKHFNQQAVEIALMKQSHCEQFSLTRVELFSAIKYIEFKYLKKLLNSQYASETNRAFSILEEDKKWLIDMVIPQNLKMFHHAIGLKKSKSSNHLQKAIYVLSLLPLDKDEINTTLSHLRNLAEETQLLLREKFQRLTGFLIKNQEILYPKSIKKEALIEIIIGHLQGLVNNSNELRGLQDNGYADVYYCASQRKLKIDNQEIVNALLEMVSQYTIFEQTMISRGLLIPPVIFLAEKCYK